MIFYKKILARLLTSLVILIISRCNRARLAASNMLKDNIINDNLTDISRSIIDQYKNQQDLIMEKTLKPKLIYQNIGDLPSLENPVSQLCTSNQLASLKYFYWMKQMNKMPRIHRKEWEWAYISEVLVRENKLINGSFGLGFGCGLEPLPVLFVKYGSSVTVTDMSEIVAKDHGWLDTSQFAKNLASIYQENSDLGISLDEFMFKASYREVDMNKLPHNLGMYDYLWSSCALEHLGSLKHGLDFVINSCAFLKPGGVAVHTTEFNLTSNEETIESEHLSIYRKCDLESLKNMLIDIGVDMDYLNLENGSAYPDLYVDLPPYKQDTHLRLAVGKFAVTSVGLILRKRSY